MNKGDIKKIYCNNCSNDTEHTVLEHYEIDYPIYEEGHRIASEWIGYNFVQCNGCKNCSLEKYWTASFYYDQDGEQMFDFDYYPKRDQKEIKYKRFINIPSEINKLYRQVVESFNSDMDVLCSIGIRSLVEAILKNKNIQGHNLEEKITNATYFPENIRNNLHSLRFIGNDATHDLHTVDKDTLEIAINVVEDILNLTYELDYRSTLVNSRVANQRLTRNSTANTP